MWDPGGGGVLGFSGLLPDLSEVEELVASDFLPLVEGLVASSGFFPPAEELVTSCFFPPEEDSRFFDPEEESRFFDPEPELLGSSFFKTTFLNSEQRNIIIGLIILSFDFVIM